MPIQADTAYMRTRVGLEAFELSNFSALRSFIPDYYRDGRDDTFWGFFLRCVSQTMAKLNWKLQYDLVSQNPAFLNPADLLRQYGAPLQLSRNYPGTTQYDLDLKKMILDLLSAYRQGATVGAIEDVLKAYTGTGYVVTELFKGIGTASDISDRNSVNVSVPLSPSAGNSAIAASMAVTQDIIADLATALDLAKPAHVGINLIANLSEDPETLVLAITDSLTIRALLQEGDPSNIMLFSAPHLNPSNLDTGLGPQLPSQTYQWFFLPASGPAVALVDDQKVSGATTPTLTLTGINSARSGGYYIVANDPISGQATSQVAKLMVSLPGVQPKPIPASPAPSASVGTMVISTQPYSQVVPLNDTVTFSAVAVNTLVPGLLSPHLNRAWEIKGDHLAGLDLD